MITPEAKMENAISYEFVKDGPFASIYCRDDKILKVYSFTKDKYQNERNILSCKIAILLSNKIPIYVPKIFEIQVNKDDVFIVMKRIEGITVNDFLKKKFVEVQQVIANTEKAMMEEKTVTPEKTEHEWVYNRYNVLKIITSLIRGLLAMHSTGYGHFDFHSNNILIQEDYSIKIIDFDTADDVEMFDPGDGVTPNKEMDYYQLKIHIAGLIFSKLLNDSSMCDISRIIKDYTVKDVIEYEEDPEMALCLYDIYLSLGTTTYELEDIGEVSNNVNEKNIVL